MWSTERIIIHGCALLELTTAEMDNKVSMIAKSILSYTDNYIGS